METFDVPAGSHPHDVAPIMDGRVWYTAQAKGVLGLLDPASGAVQEVALGAGSAPHGVILDDNGFAIVTDAGLNHIELANPKTLEVTTYLLPGFPADAALNTAALDADGDVWFTGQGGYYAHMGLARGFADLYTAPKGRGPYGITATPDGEIWFVSLAGSYLAKVDRATGKAQTFEPPTANAGTRRVWSDSRGKLWVSEWNAGQVARFDPQTASWREWRLPGDAPQAYAVYVDETDAVWLTDFGANAIVRFDPVTQTFESFSLSGQPAEVRQLNGRPGEVWGAESATDRLVVIRFPT